MRGLQWLGAAATVLALCGVASAADDAATGRKRGGGELRQKALEKFDKNGDGKLDETERAAAREEFGQHKPGDGAGMRDRRLKQFDKDGDGKLSDDERKAAREAMQKRRGEARPGGSPERKRPGQRPDRKPATK